MAEKVKVKKVTMDNEDKGEKIPEEDVRSRAKDVTSASFEYLNKLSDWRARSLAEASNRMVPSPVDIKSGD